MTTSLIKEKFIDENGKEWNRTKCEVWTRVMGYCRPKSSYNEGKKAEFCSRKNFTESATFCSKYININA